MGEQVKNGTLRHMRGATCFRKGVGLYITDATQFRKNINKMWSPKG